MDFLSLRSFLNLDKTWEDEILQGSFFLCDQLGHIFLNENNFSHIANENVRFETLEVVSGSGYHVICSAIMEVVIVNGDHATRI